VIDARLDNPRRICILKPSSLGDVVSAVPVLHAVRRKFPDAHIAWLINPGLAGVLAGESDLDEVIAFDRKRFGRLGRNAGATREFADFCRRLRRRRFDWTIDLQGLLRSGFLSCVSGARLRAGFASARESAWMFYNRRIPAEQDHVVDRNIALACGLGLEASADDFRLAVAAEARSAVEALLAEADTAPNEFLALCPGTRWANKLYPIRHWRVVIQKLAEQAPVVLIGAPDERRLCAELSAAAPGRTLNLAGRTRLPELVAAIASARALVCCDSAASLIAPAVGTPFVTLTGPTRPERTGPYGPLGEAVFADIPCIGCLRRSCPHVSCMQLLEPSRVIAATGEALARAERIAIA